MNLENTNEQNTSLPEIIPVPEIYASNIPGVMTVQIDCREITGLKIFESGAALRQAAPSHRKKPESLSFAGNEISPEQVQTLPEEPMESAAQETADESKTPIVLYALDPDADDPASICPKTAQPDSDRIVYSSAQKLPEENAAPRKEAVSVNAVALFDLAVLLAVCAICFAFLIRFGAGQPFFWALAAVAFTGAGLLYFLQLPKQ